MHQSPKLVLTIDWEDWFHICDLPPYSQPENWDSFGWRIEQNTHLLLELLRKTDAKATFFVIGECANRFPHLIQAIAKDGHEIAWHGTTHRTWKGLDSLNRDKEWLTGLKNFQQKHAVDVKGFRAPMWSLTPSLLKENMDTLMELGIQYDSSLVPLNVVGDPSYPRTPYRIGEIWELPPVTVNFFGVQAPISMSWGFRFLPWWYVRWMAKQFFQKNNYLMLAIHPWELDPDQPKLDVSKGIYFSHYAGIRNTQKRLNWFMNHFKAVSCTTWMHAIEKKRSVQPQAELVSTQNGVAS